MGKINIKYEEFKMLKYKINVVYLVMVFDICGMFILELLFYKLCNVVLKLIYFVVYMDIGW